MFLSFTNNGGFQEEMVIEGKFIQCELDREWVDHAFDPLYTQKQINKPIKVRLVRGVNFPFTALKKQSLGNGTRPASIDHHRRPVGPLMGRQWLWQIGPWAVHQLSLSQAKYPQMRPHQQVIVKQTQCRVVQSIAQTLIKT